MSDSHSRSSSASLALIGDDYIHYGRWTDWITDRQVHNLGQPGLTSEDLLAQHADLQDLRPDSIVLMAGSNDFAQRRSVEHVVRTIQLVLVTLRRELPGTRMTVQSIFAGEPQSTARMDDAPPMSRPISIIRQR